MQPYRVRLNWGAIVVVSAGVIGVIATVAAALTASEADGLGTGLESWGRIALLVVPTIGFVPLAFGTKRLGSLVGPRRGLKLLVFAAPVFLVLAQVVVGGLVVLGFLNSFAPDDIDDPVQRTTASGAVMLTALIVGVAAGVAVVRVRVVSGFARWSLLLAVALVTLSAAVGSVVNLGTFPGHGIYSISFDLPATTLDVLGRWADLPWAAGILILGLSYLHVTASPKSLAE